MASRAVLFTILLALLNPALAFNILAIISIPIPSHYMAFNNLFRELAIKGHNVTVINNFPDPDPPQGLRFVDLQGNLLKVGTPLRLDNFESHSSLAHLRNFYIHMVYRSPTHTGEILLKNENARKHLAEGVKYDVVFVEQFTSDCDLAYASLFYDAPIIGITSHVLLPKSYSRLGIPFDVASDAHYFTNAGTNPTLLHRLEIVIFNLVLKVWQWNKNNELAEAFKDYMADKPLNIEEVARERMKMVFAYQHFSITGARVTTPQLLEIGGIHIRKPKPVPQDIEDFLSSATHGAIFVSFGSILKANTMSKEMRQNFLNAFSKIPQKIIWKYENATFHDYKGKILARNWLPQFNILCHPKVLAFVSHGGMLSMQEAAHCGKPLLTVPFFGDQFHNAAAARNSGLGRTLFLADITGDNLASTLKELTSEKMQANAKRISRLWHDRPQPVMDSAIYWTEYVAKFGDAPPSLPSKNTTWFQSSLLDVYSILLAMIATTLYLVYAVMRMVIRYLWRLIVKAKKD